MKLPRQTVNELVCNGLGYCCLWFFFKNFKSTSMISRRLGVGKRAIQRHKQQFNEGFIECPGGTKCQMKVRTK